MVKVLYSVGPIDHLSEGPIVRRSHSQIVGRSVSGRIFSTLLTHYIKHKSDPRYCRSRKNNKIHEGSGFPDYVTELGNEIGL